MTYTKNIGIPKAIDTRIRYYMNSAILKFDFHLLLKWPLSLTLFRIPHDILYGMYGNVYITTYAVIYTITSVVWTEVNEKLTTTDQK